MRALLLRHVVATLCTVAAVLMPGAGHTQPAPPAGDVAVRGNRLLRDGHPWIPHGFYQIAFEAPPDVHNNKPFWAVASRNYSPQEYVEMRQAGADSVRIQVSQPGMDPRNPLFRPRFRDRMIGAVRAARAAGLTVIISVQDEQQSGEATPTDLPNDATRRVWKELAPVFGQDRDVLFELLNEPRPPPSPRNWQAWAEAMNQTIRAVREAGAANVVVADGLLFAERLAHAPPLSDPLAQVAYGSHPYAHHAIDQAPATWDIKFGNFSRSAPVIVTEWGTGYYCDANTPASVVSLLQYLQQHEIGLEVGTWDWAPAHFGSAVYNFPPGVFSSFVGPSGPLTCKDAGFGLGKTVEDWYRAGVPPTSIR